MGQFIIITASNQENLKLAKKVADRVLSKGHFVEIVDILDLKWPLFDPTQETQELQKREIEEQILKLQSSNASIWIAPEYNGGLPPAWSNFLAWISKSGDDFRAAFNGKVGAIMSFSGSGTNVLQFMRLQLSYLGMSILGRQILANYSKPAKEESIDTILEELIVKST